MFKFAKICTHQSFPLCGIYKVPRCFMHICAFQWFQHVTNPGEVTRYPLLKNSWPTTLVREVSWVTCTLWYAGLHTHYTCLHMCIYIHNLRFQIYSNRAVRLYVAYSAMHVCRDCLHILCKPHCKSSLPCYKLQMPWLIRVWQCETMPWYAIRKVSKQVRETTL